MMMIHSIYHSRCKKGGSKPQRLLLTHQNRISSNFGDGPVVLEVVVPVESDYRTTRNKVCIDHRRADLHNCVNDLMLCKSLSP